LDSLTLTSIVFIFFEWLWEKSGSMSISRFLERRAQCEDTVDSFWKYDAVYCLYIYQYKKTSYIITTNLYFFDEFISMFFSSIFISIFSMLKITNKIGRICPCM
jgi:hypothetical protein